MSSSEYVVHQILPYLYHIEEKTNIHVFMSLVIGKEKALLFDCGYGSGDLKKQVEELTDLPYELVLSHFHPDHSFGAWQFPYAWIHEKDLRLCQDNYQPEELGKAWESEPRLQNAVSCGEYLGHKCCPLKPMRGGKVFDLGEITAEIVEMPGHTPGSVGLLLREKRVCLFGDAANPTVYLFFDYSSPLKDYISMLERTKLLPFDSFLISHRETVFPKAKLDDFIRCASEAVPQKSAVDPATERFCMKTPVYRYEIGPAGQKNHPDFASVLYTKDKL